MKTVAVLLAFVIVVPGLAAPAAAGSSTDAALALGAFAVLNQLVRGETILHGGWGREVVRETVVVHQRPHVVYAPPPPPPPVAYYAPPPGRWLWHGSRWVWHGPPGHAPKHWKKHRHGHH